MKLYVGTYKKYNEGSIKGAWLDLDKFKNADEFYRACKRLHRDERDPEFMFQDVETDPGCDWQEGLYSESSIPREYWTLKAEAAKENGETAERIGEVTINEERHGVEIRFASMPSEDVRNDLKANGWRWSKFSRCWYNRDTDENRATAERIASAKIEGNAPGTDGGKFVNPAAADKEWKDEQTAIIAEYRKHLEANKAHLWNHDVERHLKGIAAVVKLENGEWMEIERPSIETRHCEGEDDGRGRSMEAAQAGCDYFKTERGWKRTNLHGFDKHIVATVGRKALRSKALVTQIGDKRGTCEYELCKYLYQYGVPGSVRIGSYIKGYPNTHNPDGKPITEENARRIRRAYAHVRRDFRRRLDAYWRRFGASKLYTWTYWTEA